jgi:SHS2 domain-containing protein
MSYEFLEDIAIADIAFRAWGEDLQELFKAASDATINTMIDNLDSIEPKQTRTFSLENDALDLLLFNFLQELIYYKDTEQLLLRAQQVQIELKTLISFERSYSRRKFRSQSSPPASRCQSCYFTPFPIRKS